MVGHISDAEFKRIIMRIKKSWEREYTKLRKDQHILSKTDVDSMIVYAVHIALEENYGKGVKYN